MEISKEKIFSLYEELAKIDPESGYETFCAVKKLGEIIKQSFIE